MNTLKFLIIILLLPVSFFLNASDNVGIDAYKIEVEGYFTGLSVSEYGIVATDNYASRIYLVHDGNMEILFAAAGCGRYYTLSPDRKKIGFKIITQDGKQIPAILDILSKQVTYLHSQEPVCGQVSFSNNGKIAFTAGNFLHVVNGTTEQNFDLEVYSNITPISPDGNFVVYNNDDDRLILMNLLTGQTEQISDKKTGYMLPSWSPDGSKIEYSSVAGMLCVYDMAAKTTYTIGEGFNPSWSEDSQFILFTRTFAQDFAFAGSDIFVSRYDATGIINLTNTSDINEMGAIFSGNSIIYHTYDKRELFSSEINSGKNGLNAKDLLFEHPSALPISTYNINYSAKAETRVPGTVPYINQVYDTPEWHYGYGSCAPTTAMMAIAYYNKLPKWPIQTSNGAGTHTSNYGAYVADKYRFSEIYYQDVSATGGGENAWGGYGYMWTGSYSPHSRMRQYIQNHNITSVLEDADNWTKAKAQINSGYPFPVCNLLSTAGHLTLGIGYIQLQHTMIFNDPYGDKNHTSWPNWYGQDSYYDWPGYNNGYQNLNTVAWTVTAEAAETSYNDTLIDDIFYNHGFYIYNQGVSHMRYFHDNNTGGYNSHFWWTYTSSSTTTDTCYVTWTPNLSVCGYYEVTAYIPSSVATATSARYKVFYYGGSKTVIVNQATHYGQWVSLGMFPFAAGSSGFVRLGDAAGVQSQVVAFDAVKFSKIGPSYTATAICSGDSILLQGSYRTTPGVYYDTLVSVVGCDSIVATNLTVKPAHNLTGGVEIFYGDSIFLQGAWQKESGIYTDVYTNMYGCDSTIVTTLSVIPEFYIFGGITYGDTAETPMNNTKVYLIENGTVVDSVITGINGDYSFPAYNGSFTISAAITKPWGGVNSTDALVVQRYYTGLDLLTEPRLTAADVNLSNYINSTDALLIKRRFTGLDTSFLAGDWYFNPQPVVIADADVEMNFMAICFGDVNGSYSPPFAKTNGTVDLTSIGSIPVSVSSVIDIPVSIGNVMQIGAASLIFTYPPEIEVLSVTQVAGGMNGLITNIVNGKVFVAWSDLQSINLQEDDVILTLQVRVLTDNGSEINFGLLPESEFANESAQVINGVTLYMPALVPVPTGVKVIDAAGEINIFPNPATGRVYISNAARAAICITDVIGQQIFYSNASKSAITSIDLSKYSEGTYIVKIVKSDTIVTKKLVIKK